ncbi:MAG: TolC family protein [Bacteroidetes bacterium]|nr:TolC family protein [Bacteroidota bacterium]
MKLYFNRIFLIIFFSISLTAFAQTVQTDSLSLDKAIKLTLSNQPLVNQAVEQINAIDAKIKEQKSSYYPNVEGNLSYAWIGPIISLGFPGMGIFDFNTPNNYDMHVSAAYTLYDFGQRDATLDLIKSYKLSAEEKINLVRSNLAYSAIQTFYSILFLEKSIAVKNDQINTLNQHMDITKKKVESGSATDFDVLTTEVRVASAQNEKIDLENALNKEKIYLRNLLGFSSDQPLNLAGDFSIAEVNTNEDSLITLAYGMRPEIKLARDAESSAKISKRVSALGDRPTISLEASYGLKNGFFPNLDVLRGNWLAAVSANIPIFNGNRTDAKVEESEANLKSSSQEILVLERKIKTEVQSALSDLMTNKSKLNTTKIQVKQAQEAVDRAEMQYRDGVITNLDLIDSETALSEARLLYLQVLYKNVISKYALDKVVGTVVW